MGRRRASATADSVPSTLLAALILILILNELKLSQSDAAEGRGCKRVVFRVAGPQALTGHRVTVKRISRAANPLEKGNCHFLWPAVWHGDIIHGKLEVVPPRRSSGGSNYRRSHPLRSPLEIPRFSPAATEAVEAEEREGDPRCRRLLAVFGEEQQRPPQPKHRRPASSRRRPNRRPLAQGLRRRFPPPLDATARKT